MATEKQHHIFSMGHWVSIWSGKAHSATLRNYKKNQDIRISLNPIEIKAERIEVFFYNRGMEIAMGVLYLALDYLVAAHGAYQFTKTGGWTTDKDMMRITVPIARAGGRLVTFNCAVLLLAA